MYAKCNFASVSKERKGNYALNYEKGNGAKKKLSEFFGSEIFSGFQGNEINLIIVLPHFFSIGLFS